jgi:hypothetical protein
MNGTWTCQRSSGVGYVGARERDEPPSAAASVALKDRKPARYPSVDRLAAVVWAAT